VIRGDDHISNTPKQIALYRALGKEPPIFAHVPMILGTDGKKLSKRHGATAVGDYQDMGILPAAMRNFLALLGWSPGGDQEIVTEAEMIARFALEDIQKKAAVFDPAKLEWMNGQYLSQLPAETLLAPVERQLGILGVTHEGRDLLPIITAVKARARTITHVAEQVASRLDGSRVTRDEKGAALVAKMGERFATCLTLAHAALEALPAPSWDATTLEGVLRQVAEGNALKLGDVMQPVRVALTGGTVSEPVHELLAVVGRDESLARMARAIG
jgi:glutamyl-tRNA synthetase